MQEGAGFESVKFALHVQLLEGVPPSTYQNEFINIEHTGQRAVCSSHVPAGFKTVGSSGGTTHCGS